MNIKPIIGLISIHDVMPETLGRVEQLFDHIQSFGDYPVTLLIVPGRDWQPEDIQRLQSLIEKGAVLCGHGWFHKARKISGIKHRLHSLFISRDVAEHLALKRSELIDLVEECFQWFANNHLPAPELYVPPAWAMGALNQRDLEQLPFVQYELINGIYDCRDKKFHRNPMVGFEARDKWRIPFIRIWNFINFRRARKQGLLRIGIHPDDHILPLARDMDLYLSRIHVAKKYSIISQINT